MRAHTSSNLRVRWGLPALAILALLFQPVPAHGQPASLMLWNTLGSDTEVSNSAFGPDLEFYDPSVHGGTPNCPNVVGQRAYVPGVFGNAITLAANAANRACTPWS